MYLSPATHLATSQAWSRWEGGWKPPTIYPQQAEIDISLLPAASFLPQPALTPDTKPQRGLACKLPVGAEVKSSLGGIGLPCCLHAMCSPPWCGMEILPWAPTHPSARGTGRLLQGASCNAEVSRGAGCAALCRHSSVPLLSSRFLLFYSSCFFSCLFKFFLPFIPQTGWNSRATASAVSWASSSSWQGEDVGDGLVAINTQQVCACP